MHRYTSHSVIPHKSGMTNIIDCGVDVYLKSKSLQSIKRNGGKNQNSDVSFLLNERPSFFPVLQTKVRIYRKLHLNFCFLGLADKQLIRLRRLGQDQS